MSKYLASIIDIINHDVSVEKVRSSNDKIMELMRKVKKLIIISEFPERRRGFPRRPFDALWEKRNSRITACTDSREGKYSQPECPRPS